jgi:hypothetical protein
MAAATAANRLQTGTGASNISRVGCTTLISVCGLPWRKELILIRDRTRQEQFMNPKHISIFVAMVGMCGCAGMQRHAAEPAEPGETKVKSEKPESAKSTPSDWRETFKVNETVKTPAGTFHHCVHLRETTPLEADVSHKYYAPGVGMIKDDEFELAEKP